MCKDENFITWKRFLQYWPSVAGVHWSFWRNFHHWLHWKLSFWQLSVRPVMKISSKWRHFRFSGTDLTFPLLLVWTSYSFELAVILDALSLMGVADIAFLCLKIYSTSITLTKFLVENFCQSETYKASGYVWICRKKLPIITCSEANHIIIRRAAGYLRHWNNKSGWKKRYKYQAIVFVLCFKTRCMQTGHHVSAHHVIFTRCRADRSR